MKHIRLPTLLQCPSNLRNSRVFSPTPHNFLSSFRGLLSVLAVLSIIIQREWMQHDPSNRKRLKIDAQDVGRQVTAAPTLLEGSGAQTQLFKQRNRDRSYIKRWHPDKFGVSDPRREAICTPLSNPACLVDAKPSDLQPSCCHTHSKSSV